MWKTLLALVLLLILAGCGTLLRDTESSVVVDEGALARVRHQLAPALVDLNDVDEPAHIRRARPAHFVGCALDSGEVFQPRVYRVWPLTEAARTRNVMKTTEQGRQAASAVAAQLITQGWKGTPELKKFAFTGLTKSFGDYKIGISIQAFNDAVITSAKAFPSPRPCSRR